MTRAISNAWSASANNTADFENCIEEGTFGLNDTVVQAWATGKKLTGPEFWTSDVSLSMFGRCYTLDLDVKLGVNAITGTIMLNLTQTSPIRYISINRTFTILPLTASSQLKSRKL